MISKLGFTVVVAVLMHALSFATDDEKTSWFSSESIYESQHKMGTESSAHQGSL